MFSLIIFYLLIVGIVYLVTGDKSTAFHWPMPVAKFILRGVEYLNYRPGQFMPLGTELLLIFISSIVGIMAFSGF